MHTQMFIHCEFIIAPCCDKTKKEKGKKVHQRYLLKLFGKLLLLSHFPVQILSLLTQLVLDLMADRKGKHKISILTDKWLTHTCLYANILGPKQHYYTPPTHTHTKAG